MYDLDYVIYARLGEYNLLLELCPADVIGNRTITYCFKDKNEAQQCMEKISEKILEIMKDYEKTSEYIT